VDVPPHYDTFAEFQYAYHYGDMYVPYIKQEEPLKIECQHFLDCVRQGLTPLTNGEQGLKLVKILEAASASLKRNGASVNLNLTARDTSETPAWAPAPAPAPQLAQAEAVKA